MCALSLDSASTRSHVSNLYTNDLTRGLSLRSFTRACCSKFRCDLADRRLLYNADGHGPHGDMTRASAGEKQNTSSTGTAYRQGGRQEKPPLQNLTAPRHDQPPRQSLAPLQTMRLWAACEVLLRISISSEDLRVSPSCSSSSSARSACAKVATS